MRAEKSARRRIIESKRRDRLESSSDESDGEVAAVHNKPARKRKTSDKSDASPRRPSVEKEKSGTKKAVVKDVAKRPVTNYSPPLLNIFGSSDEEDGDMHYERDAEDARRQAEREAKWDALAELELSDFGDFFDGTELIVADETPIVESGLEAEKAAEEEKKKEEERLAEQQKMEEENGKGLPLNILENSPEKRGVESVHLVEVA